MDVDLTPIQKPEIAAAIAAAVASDGPSEPDPWWQAGIEEALDT